MKPKELTIERYQDSLKKKILKIASVICGAILLQIKQINRLLTPD